ncbi:unnamed protein product [Parascedosporium putredinis]|uniref:Epidermal growth factor receptor-like transmembrane-juxtamembrane segment domain-containing protein n=1 Tax=Parascedosporium putredinis TaxID=1442378 RepID=A0A9P1GY95_9PEZI|nr:unnamed protein product [Parascedosporium putredinis]CAI7990540.1 unnamed protein product [Parascedosporium putredinis]
MPSASAPKPSPAKPAPSTTPSTTPPLAHPRPQRATPLPTPRPRADGDEEITTALVGPDNICGYVDGRPGASFYCPAGNNCVLFTARTTLTGAVACCNTDACNLRLTCMDYNQVVNSKQCDNGCMVDAFTLKCTDSARPFCNTASFATSIFDYWCNDLDLSSAQTLFTTFLGQTGRSFEPLPSPPPSTSKKVNAGAIAGGVVGGLAGLALLGLAAFFLIRRRNNNNAASTSPMQPQMVYAPLPGQPQFPNTTPSPGRLPVGPDRMSSISPHHGDPRASTLVNSPTLSTTSGAAFSPYPQQGVPGQPQPYAPNQAHVHEAGGDAADHHRGQIHELH